MFHTALSRSALRAPPHTLLFSILLATPLAACGPAVVGTDAPTADAGLTDTARADAGLPDAGTDGGMPDGGMPDGGMLDGGMPDASLPDAGPPRPALSATERAILATLSPLPTLPPDPTNTLADDPAAARLGQRLFFDARYSGPLSVASDLGAVGEEGRVSCASCHGSPSMSDDRSDPPTVSIGAGFHTRNAPSMVNSSFYRWTNWGGRFAAQWELPPIVVENGAIMNSTRLQLVHHIFDNHRAEYEAVFGPMDPAIADLGRFPARGKPKASPTAIDGPWELMSATDRVVANRVFVNFGRAIQAYTRLLVSRETPFDAYAAGDETALSDSAIRGYQVFVGEGRCITCHFGPTLADDEFHNLGVFQAGPAYDDGRFRDIPGLLSATLGGNGTFSDDPVVGAARLAGVTNPPPEATRGAFRTPSLRGLDFSAPYMHAGQLATLEEVIEFYDRGGDAPVSGTRDGMLLPLGLTAQEEADLLEFLHSLSGDPIDSALRSPLP